jgi:prepilin-type processing-associated H-X9-DG protein
MLPLELLVVVAMIAVLVAVMLPALSKEKAKAMRISCVGRLKNIGLANRIFATDNGDLFPWQRSSATNRINFPDLTGLSTGDQVVRIYQTLSNELSIPKIIVCPADVRNDAPDWRITTNNISYFVGLSSKETLPQTLMAGDRNLAVDGKEAAGRVELKNGAKVAWDKTMHRLQGNVAMGDGSVQQLSTENRLKETLANTGVETNVLLIP